MVRELLIRTKDLCEGETLELPPGKRVGNNPVVQNIILLVSQIGLAQENKTKNKIQGAHCVLETPYRGTIVF